MPQYIMSLTAQDRSGIVAAVSQALLGFQGNIEAASQTVHRGYFAMMVLCDLPPEVTPDQLLDAIHAQAGADLHVYLTDYQPPASDPTEAHTFIVTAVGPDKPGILHTLTTYLGSRQINIDDLYCFVDQGSFVVICEVSIPATVDVFMLQADLESIGRTGGFTANVQHENIFVATNELPLTRKTK